MKLYFVFGDVLTNVVTGAAAGVASAFLFSQAWPMWAAMPLGMMVLAGLWLGVVVSAVAVGAVLLTLRVPDSNRSSVTAPLTGAESEVVA